MKRIVINKNEVGMVVKNNVVKRVLTEGSYWLGFKETLNIYDMAESFNVNHDIDVLLTIPKFKALVEVVEVMDTEVCLVFVNNHFKFLLEAGRHVFWKGMNEYCFQIENMEHYEVPETISKAYLKACVFKDKVQVRLNFNLQFKVVEN